MSPAKVPVAEIAEPAAPKSLIMTPLLESFKQARSKGTPIICVETPDPGATEAALLNLLGSGRFTNPTFRWDSVRGLTGINPAGITWANGQKAKLDACRHPAVASNACASALLLAQEMPERSAVFFHNLHLYIRDPKVMQATWNLRDPFKESYRTLVPLGVSFQMPPELAGDVIVLDEPLPNREQLGVMFDAAYANAIDQAGKSNKLPPMTPEIRTEALDAMVGLPYFAADSCMSLALKSDKLDVPNLWIRKIKAIENSDGLRVWKSQPEDSLDNLKEIDNAVGFVRDLHAADAFGAIAFIDEGDKALKGGLSEFSGDSGVASDQVGTVLSYIEDTKSVGIMLAGLAGCGKTQLVKALGATAKKPVIVFDLGGMKGGHVGESERTLRNNLKVLSATAEGRILFMMTANKTTVFTPEVKRRFPFQFFFDIPKSNATIWDIYIPMFGLTKEQAYRPEGFAQGWTGAEVRRACEFAALLKKKVTDVEKLIIPMAVSDKLLLDEMRQNADGKFLSAATTYDGWYHAPKGEEEAAVTPVRKGRALMLDGDV